MERLTGKHYGTDDYYMTCSETCDAYDPKIETNADRAKIRSRTYSGIAQAFANQWGSLSPTVEKG